MKLLYVILLLLISIGSNAQTTKITLGWEEVETNCHGYFVYSKEYNLTNWIQTQLPGSLNTMITIPVIPNMLYQFYVTAYHSTNESLPSNQVRNQTYYVNGSGRITPITLTDVSSTNFNQFVLASSPTNGTLSGTAPNVSFNPTPAFLSIDRFSYKSPELFGNQNVTNYYTIIKIPSNFVPSFGVSP